jgi:uncharacterized protein YjiS (DUF1127 family)
VNDHYGEDVQIANHKSQMTEVLLSFVTAVSLLVALVAWRQARRTAQRLEQLTQMYWELKYQHGELRVRLQGGPGSAPSSEASPAPATSPGSSFIPLTALKR